MAQFLASSVQVIEEPPSIRTLPDLATAIPAFVGLSERGPLHSPTIITSFDDYRRLFGSFVAGYEMPLAVRHFFLNGGRQAVIVRVLEGAPVESAVTLLTEASAPTAGTVLGSVVGPFDLEPGDDLDIDVDGGGPATATFTAAAGAATSVNTEPFALNDLDDLLVSVDGGAPQTIVFNTAEFALIGAATAAEVAAVINAEIVGASATVSVGAVVITSDLRGTDSSIEITGGAAAAAFAFPAGPQNGTGNVANIDAVTVAEVKTIVEAAVAGCTVSNDAGAARITSNTTGPTSSVLVQASSTADDEIGFDNATHLGTTGAAAPTLNVEASSPGTWGDDLSIKIEPPTSGNDTGAAAEFNLTVIKNGVIEETWPNVTLLPTAPNYVETIVNDPTTGSGLITVEDQLVAVSPPDNRPNGSATVGGVTTALTGGSDGAALTDATFTGGGDPDKGMNSLESANITLLAIPDRATVAVQAEMITFCETVRNFGVFAVFDPPAGSSLAGIRAHKASLPDSEMYGLYWPRITIPNPDSAVFGSDTEIVVAPSGAIMGMMARNDSGTLVGPFGQPAGVEAGLLLSVLGVEERDVLRSSNRDLIFPERINPITRLETGGGIFVDGARTGKGNGNFPSIGERRGVSYIEQTLKQGLQFVRHQNNTPDLRGSVHRTVRGFLMTLTRNGCFATKEPQSAFVVDADVPGRGINNASVRAQGKLFVRVGVATAKPAEYVVILVSQDTRALQESA